MQFLFPAGSTFPAGKVETDPDVKKDGEECGVDDTCEEGTFCDICALDLIPSQNPTCKPATLAQAFDSCCAGEGAGNGGCVGNMVCDINQECKFLKTLGDSCDGYNDICPGGTWCNTCSQGCSANTCDPNPKCTTATKEKWNECCPTASANGGCKDGLECKYKSWLEAQNIIGCPWGACCY